MFVFHFVVTGELIVCLCFRLLLLVSSLCVCVSLCCDW